PAEELLEPMRQALVDESDGEIAGLLRLGIAQLDLGSSDETHRVAAVEILRQDGDVSHKAALEALLRQDASTGTFLESSEEVRERARRALSAIERRASLISLLANFFYGLSLGSVLLLAALGLAITFGLMKVINMAHGEMLML